MIEEIKDVFIRLSCLCHAVGAVLAHSNSMSETAAVYPEYNASILCRALLNGNKRTWKGCRSCHIASVLFLYYKFRISKHTSYLALAFDLVASSIAFYFYFRSNAA